MIRSLRTLLTRRRIQRLIRDGVGVREAAWQVPAAGDSLARAAIVEEITRWVRKAMGDMHRPYGVDHVALALACRDEAGRVHCANSLGVVRPAAFYGAEGPRRIAAFFDDMESVALSKRSEVVGALLSLGDIAFELDLARAA